jgi:hypothetical protein
LSETVRLQRQQRRQELEAGKRWISLLLPVEVIKQIEETKGDIPRSLFVRRAIAKALMEQEEKEEQSKIVTPAGTM